MNEFFLGQSVAIDSTVTDANDALVTPSSITVTVTDPTGATVTVGTPTAVSTGVYQAIVAPTTVAGVYLVKWTAVVSGFTGIDMYNYFVRSTVPLASPDDLSTYLGQTLDENRATLLLNMAQALCESILTPLPPGAMPVILDVASRGFSNPTNVDQQSAGPFAATYGTVSGGMWLTTQNKATLRLLAGKGGAFTFDTMPETAGQNLPWWDTGVTIGYGDWDQIP